MTAIGALVVRVPEAEPMVRDLRQRLDPSAAEGVAAHITILVPFIALPSNAHIAELQALFARFEPFDYAFTAVGRWPATTWLAPEPADRFAALTQALVRAFPGWRPYGGRHPQVVPHLTVADGSTLAADEAEAALKERLTAPLRARCSGIELIDNRSGRWQRQRMFALGR